MVLILSKQIFCQGLLSMVISGIRGSLTKPDTLFKTPLFQIPPLPSLIPMSAYIGCQWFDFRILLPPIADWNPGRYRLICPPLCLPCIPGSDRRWAKAGTSRNHIQISRITKCQLQPYIFKCSWISLLDKCIE